MYLEHLTLYEKKRYFGGFGVQSHEVIIYHKLSPKNIKSPIISTF